MIFQFVEFPVLQTCPHSKYEQIKFTSSASYINFLFLIAAMWYRMDRRPRGTPQQINHIQFLQPQHSFYLPFIQASLFLSLTESIHLSQSSLLIHCHSLSLLAVLPFSILLKTKNHQIILSIILLFNHLSTQHNSQSLYKRYLLS